MNSLQVLGAQSSNVVRDTPSMTFHLRMSTSYAREIKILRMLSHELVVPLVDCWHEADYVCMVFELFRQVCVNVGVGAHVPHFYVPFIGSETMAR